MSLQVFLQAQLLGAEEFLARQLSGHDDTANLTGRCAWLNLFCEVLPRALLTELRLSRMLLGSSSAEQFLLVLAEEDIPRANELLTRAADAVARLSGNTLRLIWAATENLGTWPVVRERLDDALLAKTSAALAESADALKLFSPFDENVEFDAGSYFEPFGRGLPDASAVGWSPDRPAHLAWNAGQYSWPLKEQSSIDEEGILFPRRFALNDAGNLASPAELAARAEGAPRWGILKGDVDHFAVQLKSAGTIEDHIHISALFKEFFAGELSILCTLPDFWRKVSILYRGGDDFAVMGAWDALLLLARELERLFERFAEQNLQSVMTLEAKSVSMALALAPEMDSPVSSVFKDALEQLHRAKAIETGTLYLFGRTLEWKRLADAEELKSSLVRLVRDFGYSPDYIHDLASVYREAVAGRASRRKAIRVDKPWRIYMRLARVIPQSRGKEINNVRNAVIASLIGKRTAVLKLRPSARVGLEWARLAAGNLETKPEA
jgi:CRISPR-associated protein Csm1